jgi:hypothetical protein
MWAALRAFTVSLIQEFRSGHRLGLSMLWLRVGDYFRVWERDMDTAEACYRASLEMIDFIGVPIHQSDAFARIALCQAYRGDTMATAASLSQARVRLSRIGITHQVDTLDRRVASLGTINKQLFISFDAVCPPILIGQWHFSG